jgi:membrane protein YqaA with SNARE-associated domain
MVSRSQPVWINPAVSVAWAGLEATVFFIVPDVFLTRLALRSGWTTAWQACLWATLGAVIGGAIIYLMAAHGWAEPLGSLFTLLPGISPALLEQAGTELDREGWSALFIGALDGTPYKLYALHAGIQSLPLGPFLVISVCARLARFVISATVAWSIGRIFLRTWSPHKVRNLHLTVWTAFYVCYFWGMGH